MIPLAERGFAFAPGVFEYSFGAVALPGYRMERMRFRKPLPLAAGFARIKAQLEGLGRPLTAFAACELRSPEPFTEAGFTAFNKIYAATLQEWGIFTDGQNPVARSNVCPEISPPAEPSFHAFSYSVPDAGAPPSFVIAGGTEVRKGRSGQPASIVALGDRTQVGISAKNAQVMEEMERRMGVLGVTYAQVTAVNLYTVYDPYPIIAREVIARGAPEVGVEWHYCRPPVVGMDWEMDCRAIPLERVAV